MSEDRTESDEITFNDIIWGLNTISNLKPKDIEVLRIKLELLQENLENYEISKSSVHGSARTKEQEDFIAAGKAMQRSVMDLLRDDKFEKALKDETFKTNFFATLDSFAKLAADPTKINETDAEAYNNFDNEIKTIKSSIWSSARACFKVFFKAVAILAIAAFVGALIVSLCTPVGPAVMAAVALGAVAYAYTNGVALGAAGIGYAVPIVKAGMAFATPIVKVGVTNVAVQSTEAIAAEVVSGVVVVGTTAKISSSSKDASATERLSEKLISSSDGYKSKLKNIQDEFEASEAPEKESSDRRCDRR